MQINLVFPLIENRRRFCYHKIHELFSKLSPLQRERKPARRKLVKEDILLARRIAQLRKARGITQEELSDVLAMNHLYITHVEAKKQGFSLPMVYRIAKVLGVSLSELFAFEPENSK